MLFHVLYADPRPFTGAVFSGNPVLATVCIWPVAEGWYSNFFKKPNTAYLGQMQIIFEEKIYLY